MKNFFFLFFSSLFYPSLRTVQKEIRLFVSFRSIRKRNSRNKFEIITEPWNSCNFYLFLFFFQTIINQLTFYLLTIQWSEESSVNKNRSRIFSNIFLSQKEKQRETKRREEASVNERVGWNEREKRREQTSRQTRKKISHCHFHREKKNERKTQKNYTHIRRKHLKPHTYAYTPIVS